MQTVDVVYYLDILSSWCFVTDRALVRLRENYGERISIDWRLAVSHGGEPFGYTHEQMAGFYARTNALTGVQLNPDWVEPGHEVTSAHACSAAEAARSLGVGDDRVRKGLAHAAMIDGAQVSRREVALRLAAELSGLDAFELNRAMDGAAVAERIALAAREFKELGATVRPTFVMTNNIGDRVVLSGVWAYEPLDAVIGGLLGDAEGYERFNADG